MNDISALLVATTVLSIGGMGMFMYKSTDETPEEELDESTDETTSSIDLGNVWNSITGMFNFSEDERTTIRKKYKEKEDDEDEDEFNDEDEPNEDDDEVEEDEYYERPKKKQQRYKTKRNRKTNGNTKRRY